MANIKSVRKRAKQALVRRDHNVSLRTRVRSAIKDVKKAIAAGNKGAAEKQLQRDAGRDRPRGGERHPAPQRRRPAQEPPRASGQGPEIARPRNLSGIAHTLQLGELGAFLDPSVAHAQLVVLREVEQEPVGHRLDLSSRTSTTTQRTPFAVIGCTNGEYCMR